MTFRGKEWERHGNHYNLVGTEINVYQWNSGKNANFMVTAGYRKSTYKQLSFSKGPSARDAAITYALSLKDKYRIEGARI